MPGRTLDQWLRWQESLHLRAIDLGLERIRQMCERLQIPRPAGPVFTVAGTNGKGSTVALLDAFLRGAGLRTGAYTSPHLVRYNERVAVNGTPATDEELIAAFESIEAVRGTIELTFFEYGTLAALLVFAARRCDAWVLEVGMGGRLDAVNVVDPDYSLITTIALDHEEYLGADVEAIAAEKAGILRPGRPGFYGDRPLPEAIRYEATERGAELHVLGEHFDYLPGHPLWSWRGGGLLLESLTYPPAATPAQLRNISLVLAVIGRHAPAWLADRAALQRFIRDTRPPGRFQIVEREHQWVLDVAHNPQAAATLRQQLATLPGASSTTVVLGMLADKNLKAFAEELRGVARHWIVCPVGDRRSRSGAEMAAELRRLGLGEVVEAESPTAAVAMAHSTTAPGGRIVVCGSFRIVGPALQALGIY
jgi:dihydrofolate synthase/folylpolyglutamate synthase